MKYESMKPHSRHTRQTYYVVGEGIYSYDDKGNSVCGQMPKGTEPLDFRFSRIGDKGDTLEEAILLKVAEAMTKNAVQPDAKNPAVPAGFTYLGQFIDHDLTLMRIEPDADIGNPVNDTQLLQERSPTLDLDSLYGRGPKHASSKKFYADNARLKLGTTARTPFPDSGTDQEFPGFDLPRVGKGPTKISARRKALIPDLRNDENLAVAQTHLAFMRFHNRVTDHLERSAKCPDLYQAARAAVVKHYQWMIRTDFLPRIVDKAIVEDVFAYGRKYFEPTPKPGSLPTMPVEFSVAAFRLGHSMIRAGYQWNRVFRAGGPGGGASLLLLFQFSGTSGVLSPPPASVNDPESGEFERLPSNWIADFRRLFDFSEAGRADLTVTEAEFNVAKRIDTALVNPLDALPPGSFGGNNATPAHERNLALRNLLRAQMVQLASGQQMAQKLNVTPLSAAQILRGKDTGSLDLSAALTPAQQAAFTSKTPLWFYILREAEINDGILTGVGGRIVAEVFHRAMEGSKYSIVGDKAWRPDLGPDQNTFRMVDLLLFAFEGRADLLNPLGA